MRNTGENRLTPGVAGGGQSFPLPLSTPGKKCTVLWSIAGFDPSNGAGITADLMTFAAHGFFGCSAITALTVQSTVGVFGSEPVAPAVLRATLDRLEEDLPFAGLKIGMLGTAAAAEQVGAFLEGVIVRGNKHRGPVVLDPVLRSSSGRVLLEEAGLPVLADKLLPFVNWITPNWAELEVLCGARVVDLGSAEHAARRLQERQPHLNVIVTGGDQSGEPVDMLVPADESVELFRGERVETRSTHGTGCAFSSALLCALVAGAGAVEAVQRAKQYVENALRAAPGVGAGKGPMGLLWPLQGDAEAR